MAESTGRGHRLKRQDKRAGLLAAGEILPEHKQDYGRGEYNAKYKKPYYYRTYKEPSSF